MCRIEYVNTDSFVSLAMVGCIVLISLDKLAVFEEIRYSEDNHYYSFSLDTPTF